MQMIRKSDTHIQVELSDESGVGKLDVFQIFDGICLAYSDFRMDHCMSDIMESSNMVGVEHCREGKIEWEVGNGELAYLGSGSLSPCHYGKNQGHFEFPTHYYQGFSLTIDPDTADNGVLNDFPVDLAGLKQKILNAGTLDLSHHPQASYILGLIYEAQNKKDIHRKLACLQFLLFLDELKWSENTAKPLYLPKSQVILIKKIEKLMVTHLDHRYTLQQLSEAFGLPVNTIRRCFSGIYGCSVAAYMKKVRMEEAMCRLRTTDQTASRIAADLGYDNASKFSSAFKSYCGISPQMYRGEYQQQIGVSRSVLE